MILKRYLIKEVLSSLLVLTLFLMLLFMSNQFVRYLHWVADGKYAIGIVLRLMIAQTPLLLGLLLPLGLYLGILLSVGRLYVASEMVVLAACGMSQRQCLKILMQLAFAVAGVVALFMWVINPSIMAYKENLLTHGSGANALQMVFPGRFESTDDGRTVYYVEKLNRNHHKAYGIFMAKLPNKTNHTKSDDYWRLMSATSAGQAFDKKTKQHFLVMKQGYRYFGMPGQFDFRIVKFQKYGFRLMQDTGTVTREADAMPTWTLLSMQKKSHGAVAELQWRFSLPLSVLILAWIALPLARVSPRAGRYIQLIPAILIYVLYANLMFVGRAWIEQGVLSPLLGLWWVHGIFILVGLGVWGVQCGWQTLRFWE